jgi:hypothetical protein
VERVQGGCLFEWVAHLEEYGVKYFFQITVRLEAEGGCFSIVCMTLFVIWGYNLCLIYYYN